MGREWTTSPSELGLMMQILCGSSRRTCSARTSIDQANSLSLIELVSRNLTAGARKTTSPGADFMRPGRLMMLGFATLFWRAYCWPVMERGEVVFRPAGQEASVPEPFRLEPAIFAYELERVLATPRYTVSRLRFPSPIATPGRGEQHGSRRVLRPGRVRGHAAGGGGPAHPGLGFSAVALHGRPAGGPGGRGPVPEAALLRGAAAEGRARARAHAVPLGRHRAHDDLDAAGRLRRPARALPGWPAGPTSIRARLGVAGISLGGIVASVAVAVDPAVRDGVFLAGRRRPLPDPLGDARDREVPASLGSSRAGRFATSRP